MTEQHDCGHSCCEERHNPHHDHFLRPDQCPQCLRVVGVDEVGLVVAVEHRTADLWCQANGVDRRKATIKSRLDEKAGGLPRGLFVVSLQGAWHPELDARGAVLVRPDLTLSPPTLSELRRTDPRHPMYDCFRGLCNHPKHLGNYIFP